MNCKLKHKVEFSRSDLSENKSACREFMNSAHNQYSVRQLQKTFKKQYILLTFYVMVAQTSWWSRRSTSILFVNAETFHLTISFFFLRGFAPALQDAEGIFSAIKKTFGDEGLEQY